MAAGGVAVAVLGGDGNRWRLLRAVLAASRGRVHLAQVYPVLITGTREGFQCIMQGSGGRVKSKYISDSLLLSLIPDSFF